MKLRDLLRGLDYTCPRALPDADVTYVCHDSRKIGRAHV